MVRHFPAKLTKSYKQIARQLRTQYVEGIYRPKYYIVTFKSRSWSLNVTENGKIGQIIHYLLLVELFDVKYSASKNGLTLKSGFGVVQGH